MAGIRQFFSWSFWLLEWFALVLLAGIGFALDVTIPSENEKPIFLQGVVVGIQSTATILGVGLALFILITRFFRWACEEETSERKVLDRLTTEALDRFRESCFPELPENEPMDHNRVTLFKYRSVVWWIWPFRGFINPWGWGRGPWSGWLVVHQRSGHQTQTKMTTFLAPDDAQQCEGVAGQAWRRGAYRVGRLDKKLPDLSQVKYVGFWRWIFLTSVRICCKNSERVSKYLRDVEQVRCYAEAAHCSSRFVWNRIKRNRVCPTSLLGIPVLNKNKVRWGVLVMDSCNAHECIDTDDREFRRTFTILQNTLHGYGVMDE